MQFTPEIICIVQCDWLIYEASVVERLRRPTNAVPDACIACTNVVRVYHIILLESWCGGEELGMNCGMPYNQTESEGTIWETGLSEGCQLRDCREMWSMYLVFLWLTTTARTHLFDFMFFSCLIIP